MGKDTYMLSNTGAYSWSSGATLKGDLFRQADAFCRGQDKVLMPINTASNDGSFSQFAHADIQFRCLKDGDTELRRPTLDEFIVTSVLMPPIITLPVRRLAVVPLGSKATGKLAAHIDSILNLLRTRHTELILVERDLRPLLDEVALQHSGRASDETTVSLGKLAGADTILIYRVEPHRLASSFELKLIQVESGTILLHQTVVATRTGFSPMKRQEAEQSAKQALRARGLNEGYLPEFEKVVDEIKLSDPGWLQRVPSKEQFSLIAKVVESRVQAGTAVQGSTPMGENTDLTTGRRAAAFSLAALVAAFGDNPLGIVPLVETGREGVLILGTLERGPAHSAGVTKGDRIIAVDGQPVTTWTMPVSLPATLTVERAGKRQEVRVVP